MTGCIFKRKLSSGISWGYSFFAGRDQSGKRIQVFKSGFPTKAAGEMACKNAIAEREATVGKITRVAGTRDRRIWAVSLGSFTETGFTSVQAAESALQVAIDRRRVDEARRQAEKTTDAELTFAKYFQ